MRSLASKLMLLFVDIVLINVAVYAALFFRFDGQIPALYLNVYLYSTILLTALKVYIYYLFGLYNSLWKYASVDELLKIFMATLLGSLANMGFGALFDMMLPKSVYAIAWVLTFMLIGGSRMSFRIIRRIEMMKQSDAQKKKVMIIGAGEAGSMVIKEFKRHHELNCEPVCIIDDDRMKYKSLIHGVPVKGNRNNIKELAEELRIDEIVVAIPSAPKSVVTEILTLCKETRCKLKKLPGVYEILDNKVSIKHIRDVSIEDILGRDEVHLNTREIAGYLENETVLVTGGGGSIGSELCRQIARYKPRKLLVMDIYENNAYDLQNELRYIFKDKLDLEVLIGSVRDRQRLNEIFEKYRPGVVFHAAAHKHVPLMEGNPWEAIKNNVFGTWNVARCADAYQTRKFVMISTDKAVNPTNVMGATKRLAEMIVQSMNRESKTEFVAVRFGNVLGSNGSVIPLFKKQIARGGPVTVTHPEITRYFMTIPEAVQLVIQAGAMASGGEVFILDMGKPVKILDLATDLIRLSGFEPGTDIRIEFTGLRPGEKLYEELLMDEEGIESTRHQSIFVGKPLDLSYQEVVSRLKLLEQSKGKTEELIKCLEKVVPTYQCAAAINEVAAVAEEDMEIGVDGEAVINGAG